MKKLFLGLVTCFAVLQLAACGGSSSKTKEESASADASIKVNSGTYVVTEDSSSSDDEGMLALNVSITNKTKKSMNFLGTSDIALYDSKDNKIDAENIYTDDSKFKLFNTSKIAANKSASGYVVFEVNKNEKYELRFAPYSVDGDDEKEIVLKIDSSKYKDESDNLKAASQQYIDAVFLGKASDDASKNKVELSNDLEGEKTTFKEQFSKAVKKDFDYYEPSTAELGTLVDSFIAANQKKAKVEYNVSELTPNRAVIYVKPETINISDIDTESIMDKFVDENQDKYDGSDYDKIYQDAEKYLLQQIPTKIEETNISTPDYMDGEGYKMILTKDDKKWSVDSSDSSKNYEFDYIKSAFMGHLND
ncbi:MULTISPECIES: DUF5105 domain-containing protein [unclassified Enterococcus]|uniref:DUF5105 domain-containing protein n=1 Tax=unclassified Enterococcus TaxID=2608891 RepID=UPI001556C652|nr:MULTISPECIES: DUF5105 domain-containing protein [unclassified Enterococcus]MBS7577396.1 DUF5105 domain-containing protein [Enterococcus sp. MMGLQ5-2]MBS7584803.1 DUF5105 domain-containing protein [Enterococcus sp. MMGLQ5-1]NPD12658.1 DUF5105 domain-containing protein [Enterococcus sp. MMGLQ5-1]NPD37230.1 DUF5105 domain-containing protein [Enterococcus sp. MMGLQ5-2]